MGASLMLRDVPRHILLFKANESDLAHICANVFSFQAWVCLASSPPLLETLCPEALTLVL